MAKKTVRVRIDDSTNKVDGYIYDFGTIAIDAWGVASGTDTYTVSVDGVDTYREGLYLVVEFTNANTGSSTLNINSLGAKTLKKSVSTNLAASDIGAGQALLLYYDGTNFQVIGLGGSGSGTVNSGTQYRIAYYATTGTAVSEASAITAARALKSDANGVPTHFDTATEPSLTELSYVKGVTSAIQTQLNGKLGTGLAWLLASGGTLTGNNEIIGTGYTLIGTWNSLGTTQTNGYGLWLRNTTVAANNAQQISPSLVLEGQGWKTTATAASQSVKFAIDVLPVQGTSNPTGIFRFRSSINNASYSNLFSVTSDGYFTIAPAGIPTSDYLFKVQWNSGGQTNFAVDYNGGVYVRSGWNAFDNTFTLNFTGGRQVSSAFVFGYLNDPDMSIGSSNHVRFANSVTNGGVNGIFRSIYINTTLNLLNSTTTVYGFDYDPILTATTGLTNYAFRHTSGFVAWQSILSPSQITSNQNNYNPTGWNNGGAPSGASILRLSTDASRDLTGLTGGVSGRLVIISNVGSFDLVIKDEDAGSTAANRFALNADITIQPDEGLMFWYDATSSRWRALSI